MSLAFRLPHPLNLLQLQWWCDKYDEFSKQGLQMTHQKDNIRQHDNLDANHTIHFWDEAKSSLNSAVALALQLWIAPNFQMDYAHLGFAMSGNHWSSRPKYQKPIRRIRSNFKSPRTWNKVRCLLVAWSYSVMVMGHVSGGKTLRFLCLPKIMCMDLFCLAWPTTLEPYLKKHWRDIQIFANTTIEQILGSWAVFRMLSSVGLGSMLSKMGILQMEHPTVAVTPPECHSLEMSNVDRPQMSGETRFLKRVTIIQVVATTWFKTF